MSNYLLSLHLEQTQNLLSSLRIILIDSKTSSLIQTTTGWTVSVSLISNQNTLLSLQPTNSRDFEITQGVIDVILPPNLPSGTYRVRASVTSPLSMQTLVRPLHSLSIPLSVTPPSGPPFVSSSPPSSLPSDPCSSSPPHSSPPCSSFPLDPNRFELKLKGTVPDVWYVDRHLPRFDVCLVDTASGMEIDVTCKVKFSIVDGSGKVANDCIHDYSLHSHLTLTKGTLSFGGIRFLKVSSKAGGFFRFVFTTVPCQNPSQPSFTCVTDKIQVLSYRLYHCPKVPLDRLQPHDSLSKMPGIGTLYARRFAKLGLGRVEQLAAIDVGALGEEGVDRLLSLLRKDRGSMTLTKLSKHILQAKEVVTRSCRYPEDGVAGPEWRALPPNQCRSDTSLLSAGPSPPLVPDISISRTRTGVNKSAEAYDGFQIF